MQIPGGGFLDRGLQMQDSQAYPLLTNPCAGRKLGEDVGSCLVSGRCTHWREGGKEAWWWVVMACPSTQDLRSPPHSHPSIPYQSHGPGWRLQATEDRTGQDSMGRRHSTDPGFQIPSIPPLTPQILHQQPSPCGLAPLHPAPSLCSAPSPQPQWLRAAVPHQAHCSRALADHQRFPTGAPRGQQGPDGLWADAL